MRTLFGYFIPRLSCTNYNRDCRRSETAFTLRNRLCTNAHNYVEVLCTLFYCHKSSLIVISIAQLGVYLGNQPSEYFKRLKTWKTWWKSSSTSATLAAFFASAAHAAELLHHFLGFCELFHEAVDFYYCCS